MTDTDEPRIIKRMGHVADCTVDEVVTWCIERGLDPTKVKVTSTHLKYESPETPPERERHLAYQASALARQEEWERETLARLTAKYGAP